MATYGSQIEIDDRAQGKGARMSRNTVIDVAAVERQAQDRIVLQTDDTASPWGWRTLYRIGAAAAFCVVALIPLQAVIYVVWQPPTTVLGFFQVFQQNALVGLLNLDPLMIVVAILLALYVALSPHEPSLMLIATAFGMVGAVLFIVSREAAVSMFWLSQQYASALSLEDQAALVSAGQMLLTTYNGTAYCFGYIMSGLAMLLIGIVMLRTRVFSRATGIAGVLSGATGLVPATFGTVGFALGFISLIPLLTWLVLVGRRLPRLD
jgi:hypothetical protein